MNDTPIAQSIAMRLVPKRLVMAALAILCMACITPVSAQNDASFSETFEFIAEKINNSGKMQFIAAGDKFIVSSFVLKVSNGIMYLQTTTDVSRGRAYQRTITEDYEIPLSKLKPSVKPSRYLPFGAPCIVLGISNDGNIKQRKTVEGGEETENASNTVTSMYIIVESEETCERVARAFSHLITLSGGREPRF